MPQEVNPPIVCGDELTVTPQISTNVDNVPIPQRLQAVSVSAGQAARIQFTLRDPLGNPINLEPCLIAAGVVKARIQETMLFSACPNLPDIVCTLVNPPGNDGQVYCQLTPILVAVPGISRVEFALLDVDGNVIFTNLMYLMVNRGQWGGLPGKRNRQLQGGPPTLPEIRLHLRDSAPADNLWLGIQEFDIAEIAACIERPIAYFNESQPPLHQRFNTANFPFRYFWLEGITACLYDLASLNYTRVHLPYQQQGGLMIDDKNKAKEYAAIADKRWASYKDWVLRKKVEINAWGAVQTVGSPYYGAVWTNSGRI